MTINEFLKRVLAVLERMNIPYMVVGSVAGMAYGEPRLTQDIDIVVDLNAATADELCEEFPSPDYYVSRDAVREAVRLRTQFNIINTASGMKADIVICKRSEISRTEMERRRKIPLFDGVEGYVASPEDVIIGKMRYYRRGGSEKHLRDIAGILKVGGFNVDCNYISCWAAELGLTEIWDAIVKSATPSQNSGQQDTA